MLPRRRKPLKLSWRCELQIAKIFNFFRANALYTCEGVQSYSIVVESFLEANIIRKKVYAKPFNWQQLQSFYCKDDGERPWQGYLELMEYVHGSTQGL